MREAHAASGGRHFVHQLDGVSLRSPLPFIPASHAPVTALDVEWNCFPFMSLSTTPAELCLGVDVALRQTCSTAPGRH